MNTIKQPKGIFHIIAIQMWEFFSYYGMRSLLILFLTEKLLMSDQHAYALYGAYTSLVYVTPIIGGYLADKYLGNYWSVILGSLLMVGGHFVLSFPSSDHTTLYIALSLIICGYGFFKTNSSCLLGELYQTKEQERGREAGFSISYIGGNIGSMISPILCGFAAMKWGWHVGFSLAGIGMLIGLCIFMTGRKNFSHVSKPNLPALQKKSAGIPHWSLLLASLVLAAVGLVFVLKNLWAGYILLVICLMSLGHIINLYRKSDEEDRQKLNSIMYFMLFGTVFWAFDQQGGSSISLFIERNIDTNIGGFIIPTAFFQSINPIAVIAGGAAVAWLWKVLDSKSISVRTLMKLNIGLLLLTAGFSLITLSSKLAMASGQTTFVWLLIGLLCIGVAELFIDPVALAAITRLNPHGATGTLAGIYMLAGGSVANYLAADIAQFTSTGTGENAGTLDLIVSATQYHHVFQSILFVTIGVFVLGLLVDFKHRKQATI
ncbi:peptide MFS transporter [Aliivibrio fischeri]|uniref:peptide MFS transporter n=1 Tax=Aliivibrio fischeri TaxID=668 RepID=UPI0007C5547C|nr:oligopeptide:H+ symporter [Aliivibrio fischeri]MBP3139517.1 MFS transporter [Aliivibrio fischeri]MBP3155107.1 MFS transporter [Aliivibrio fischeri]MCE7573279.1 oligopeptide:H+ symporter [Aliivibrio fischeri]